MHSGESARVQRGFALIALLSLAALISAFLIASALNFTSAGISNERAERSMNALRQAKTALIAYAASEQWQAYKGQQTDQPGALPCPDNNDTGASSGVCSGAANRVGRLPWATIGSSDFRDASGERLWYAVSSSFYKNSANIINSDTPGLLTVTGDAPASNVVAIVFAPGEALSGQDRITQHNLPAAYLEGFTATSPDYTFNAVATPSSTANDRLLVITQADLMAVVEPVVAARIERDIKPYIVQNYLNDPTNDFSWLGGYPFAAPWGAGPGQPQSNYKGDAATPTYRGLLPITREANWVGWQTSSISVTQIAGGTGSSTVTSVDCSASTTSQISCQIGFSGGSGDRPAIQLQATLLNAAKTFVNVAAPGDETIMDSGGGVRGWSNTISPNPWIVDSTLQANGNGAVVFAGRLINAASMGNAATITLPAPSYHPISDSADTTSGWFIANQWYRQTYYAISTGLAPGGVGSCNSVPAPPTAPITPSCLMVKNLPPSYATSNDKRAILVFAGRELNGLTPRPANLANYLESANLTAANGTTPFVYEHRAGVPTTINDRVVVVSP